MWAHCRPAAQVITIRVFVSAILFNLLCGELDFKDGNGC